MKNKMNMRLCILILAIFTATLIPKVFTFASDTECNHEYSSPVKVYHTGRQHCTDKRMYHLEAICKKCNYVLTYDFGEEDGYDHSFDYDNPINIKYTDANKLTGICTIKCKNCDYSYNDTFTCYISQKPTCENDGFINYLLNDSERYFTISLPKSGHDFIEYNRYEPTCTKDGHEKGKKCKNCGYTVGMETILAKGHDFENGVEIKRKEATCIEEGYILIECANCTETLKIKTKSLEHKFVEVGKLEPTCTENGHEKGKKCSLCGVTEGLEIIPAKGHDYINAKIVDEKEATCTNDGYKEVKCNKCDHVERVEVKSTGHIYCEYFKYDATCTEDGHEAGKKCIKCDYTIGVEPIKATGHNFGEEYKDNIIEANYDREGSYDICRKCDKCNYVEVIKTVKTDKLVKEVIEEDKDEEEDKNAIMKEKQEELRKTNVARAFVILAVILFFFVYAVIMTIYKNSRRKKKMKRQKLD